jgi:hypothetical protein
MENEMKAVLTALASAALLVGAMSSISTPAAAQSHGGGFHGGGGGFHGGGFHGGGGFRGGGFHGSSGGFRGGSHDGGFRGGFHHHDRDGLGFVFGVPYGDDAFYDDDFYGYDDGSGPACGSWTWDAPSGRYNWVPC